MELSKKIQILANGAKYDVSCSSSGSERKSKKGFLGNGSMPGICHSWSDDGRCISLLKILLSNNCAYDCIYCVNRRSSDFERAEFTPDELIKITMNFYRRNYIEGLFLSSAVIKTPNNTMEKMIKVVKSLRLEKGFNGYIHLKGIPGADNSLIEEAGKYVDRMSINLEIPTSKNLMLLAPQKESTQIIKPIEHIRDQIIENRDEYKNKFIRNKDLFVPAGQTTQFMIGATNDSDYLVMKASEAMYGRYLMKRVYYSAYVPIVENNSLLPAKVEFPKLREHRLYQGDWLLRFYHFTVDEILTRNQPNFDMLLDPKCNWAINNLDIFPVEINKAEYRMILRIPGIGPVSARKIMAARRFSNLNFEDLKRMGIVLKRAKYFITCNGKYFGDKDLNKEKIRMKLIGEDPKYDKGKINQINFFDQYPRLFMGGQ